MIQAEAHLLHNVQATVVLFESLRVNLRAHMAFSLRFMSPPQAHFHLSLPFFKNIYTGISLSQLYFYSAFLLHCDSALKLGPSFCPAQLRVGMKADIFINTHGCTHFHK